jgi:hypothetical protein
MTSPQSIVNFSPFYPVNPSVSTVFKIFWAKENRIISQPPSAYNASINGEQIVVL